MNSFDNFKTQVLMPLSLKFDTVLIKGLDLDSFKPQVSTVKKLLTVSKQSLNSWEILDSFKTKSPQFQNPKSQQFLDLKP